MFSLLRGVVWVGRLEHMFDDDAMDPDLDMSGWVPADGSDPGEPRVRGVDPVPSRWDVISDPNGSLAWAATAEPGEITAQIVEVVLNLIEPTRLTRTGRIDLLLAAKRQQGWAAAVQHRALSMIAASHAELACVIDPDGKQFVVEEIRCALNVCADEAKCGLLNGTILTDQLPATLSLLEKGVLSPRKVQWLCEATYNLDPDLVPELEERVLRRGAEQSHAAFKRSLKTAVASVAPKTMQEAREDGMAERRVVFMPREDGMTTLWALLPSEGALVVQHALRALATTKDKATTTDPAGKTSNGGKASMDVEGGLADTRTFTQREADALVDMSTFILDHEDIPSEQGLKPRIVITMTLETLLGLNDLPADLDGVGPLTAEVARNLAYDPTGTWQRMIVDPVNGRCLDYGRKVHDPPADLREHSIAVHRTCVHPGCGRHARRCHLDHHQAWSDGGHTRDDNLGPLCERHHHLKHEADWTMLKLPNGYQWTTPTGHTYRSQPDPYPVTQTMDRPKPKVRRDRKAKAGPAPSPRIELPDQPPF
jgi:hypothetical protein